MGGRAETNRPSASPRGEASGETNTAGILIVGFQPPELQENRLPLFKPRSLWYFVMVTLGN